MSDLAYQTGFGNVLATEAEPGSLPADRNSPRDVPHGLVAEQIQGTGFTLERARNLRTWVYRLRPAIHDRPFEALTSPPPRFLTDPARRSALPQVQRYRPQPLPEGPVDWLDGLRTFAAAGDPGLRRGLAIHVYAATADMERAFTDIDGDLLVVPEHGGLRVQTELGWLEARPGELLILPRGLRFRVSLPDGAARGFVSELYDGHYELPERGLVGANGLASERHFRAPVAWYEDRPEDTEIVVKHGGRFWRTIAPASPFDVVAWHGRYAPFVYDLDQFMAYGSVTWDHPDPSIHTVLTHAMDTHGRNAVDVGVFRGRWDPTEHTFRPPYFRRNSAIEFNAVIKAPTTKGPYPAGAFSFTPYLTPHGISARSHAHESDRTDDTPARSPDSSLWVQFESTYHLHMVEDWLDDPTRDDRFLENFAGWRTGDLVGR